MEYISLEYVWLGSINNLYGSAQTESVQTESRPRIPSDSDSIGVGIRDRFDLPKRREIT